MGAARECWLVMGQAGEAEWLEVWTAAVFDDETTAKTWAVQLTEMLESLPVDDDLGTHWDFVETYDPVAPQAYAPTEVFYTVVHLGVPAMLAEKTRGER